MSAGSVSKANGTEIVLRVTNTQPILPFATEAAIDASAVEDERSAIDQFTSTIEKLNVLISKHRPKPAVQEEAEQVIDADGLDSLLSLDDAAGGEDYEEREGEATTEEDQPLNRGAEVPLAQDALAGDAAQSSLSSKDDEVTKQLNNLVFLGHVSAVESYFRCLTRQLVWVDHFTTDKVKDLKITYSAARHSVPELMAEALLEDMTFITADSIKSWRSSVIGVSSQELEDEINEFDRICQLRHCIVHRFGRLGTKNASKLGLSTHKDLFEKPIKLTNNQLDEIAFSLFNFVRAVNNHIYAKVMERSAKQDPDWKWDETTDLPKFELLYAVFKKSDEPNASPQSIEAYNAFKTKFEKESLTQKIRGKAQRLEKASRDATKGQEG
ncbi:hypothetical protein [Xanthomonas sacchari]|uniref:hypothetical protein n=1 Tax=Xanthomonas sacchari TaxID=56458 RepID=UPI00225281D4|nr:hypothetical protein [Xanthomonas sacchari]MCW0375131.1 hypothetical protein [Xanthomonas sacchari]